MVWVKGDDLHDALRKMSSLDESLEEDVAKQTDVFESQLKKLTLEKFCNKRTEKLFVQTIWVLLVGDVFSVSSGVCFWC